MTAVPTNTTVLNSNGPLTLYHSPTDIMAMERPIPLTSTDMTAGAAIGGVDMKNFSTVSHIHPIYGRLVTATTTTDGPNEAASFQQQMAAGMLNNLNQNAALSGGVSSYNPLTVKLIHQENGGNSIMTLPVTGGSGLQGLTDINGQRTALITSVGGAGKSHLLAPNVAVMASYQPQQQQDGSTALSHDLGHLDLSQIVTLNQQGGVQQVTIY